MHWSAHGMPTTNIAYHKKKQLTVSLTRVSDVDITVAEWIDLYLNQCSEPRAAWEQINPSYHVFYIFIWKNGVDAQS